MASLSKDTASSVMNHLQLASLIFCVRLLVTKRTLLLNIRGSEKSERTDIEKLDPISGGKVNEGTGTFLVTAVGANSSYGRISAATPTLCRWARSTQRSNTWLLLSSYPMGNSGHMSRASPKFSWASAYPSLPTLVVARYLPSL